MPAAHPPSSARPARALPPIEFPPELPVSERRAEIARAVAAHPVVIVSGETGSGKTTQLPKICLELGRGARRLIGHTQPRRIAASSVARRIAQELDTPLGELVGFKVRFADHTRPGAAVKLMTDGILLAETQSDPDLAAYDTLIDLKLIITSATIDAERFAQHFGQPGAPAPVINVSGRTYPVEVRWRPFRDADSLDNDSDDRTLMDGIVAAVDECAMAGRGDVLVFLPGEREIREAAEALRKHHPPGTEILPLYARLSAEEQERVFRPGGALGSSRRQSRAAAGRAHLAGGGQPARRPLRPGGGGRLHPPVRRGRLCPPAALHRPRGAALVAGRRDPAHEVARPGRRTGVSVRRSAAGAGDRRWLRPAGRAQCRGRWTRASAACCWPRATSRRSRRCW